MYEYQATILRTIDGDTYECDVDLGFHIHVQEKFRLARINAPELSTTDGKNVKAYVMDLLTQHGSTVTLKVSHQDKYGRWLAELILRDGTNLNDYLLEHNMAKLY